MEETNSDQKIDDKNGIFNTCKKLSVMKSNQSKNFRMEVSRAFKKNHRKKNNIFPFLRTVGSKLPFPRTADSLFHYYISEILTF